MSRRQKRLGPVLATFLVAGNMIGSGVFLLPAVLAQTGSSSLLGWLLAALGAALLAGLYAILATLRPPQEGLIDYPTRAFHPAAGFLSWAAYWSSCWIGNVAIILAAVGYLEVLIPGGLGRSAETAVLLSIIWGLALANLAGAKMMGRFAAATLLLGIVPILAATALGVINFETDIFAASWNESGAPLTRAIPPTVLTIFWAFLGLESANAVAAVVDNPRRNVAVAAVGGVLIAAIVYAAASAALFGVLPAEELAQSSAPFADVVSRLAGPVAGAVVAIAALARTIGCAGGWFLVSAQTGRAGAAIGFLPKVLSEGDPLKRPTRDVLLTAVLMSAVAFATLSPTLNDQFTVIVDFSVMLFLGVYSLSALALLRFSADIQDQDQRRVARLVGVSSLVFCVAVAATSLMG